jgi:tetratricopeptide (TPR) repeat protein
VSTRFLVPLLVASVALLATWPATDGGFVYDDLPYVVQNEAVVGDASLLGSALGEADQGLWRPVTVWSWRLQWSADAGAPAMLALNVWLHVGVSLLVLALGRRLGFSSSASALGALLFAVHPVHAEAVAWITGRSELLACGFLLMAWLAHLAEGRAATAASIVLLSLACLSKENALIGPGLFLLADLSLRRRTIPWLRLGLLAATVLGLFAARSLVLEHSLPAHGPFLDTPLAGRVVAALAILGKSLQLLLLPHSLRVHYHGSEFEQADPLLLGLVAAAAVAVVLLWSRRRPAALAILLVPATLFPVLHIVPIGEPFAERFLYLPSVPFCLAGGALLAGWSRSELDRRGLGASLIVTLLALGGGLLASRAAARVFHDDLTLWSHAVQEAPQLAMTHYNHATFLVDAGRHYSLDAGLPGALDELRSSLELRPHHAQAGWAHQTLGHYALGAIGSDPSDPESAAQHYRRALEQLPGLVDARINMAGIAVDAPELVEPEEALQLLLPLVIDPKLDPAQRLTIENIAAQLSDGSR